MASSWAAVSSPGVAGRDGVDPTDAAGVGLGDTAEGVGRTKNVTRKAALAASEKARKRGSFFMGRSDQRRNLGSGRGIFHAQSGGVGRRLFDGLGGRKFRQ